MKQLEKLPFFEAGKTGTIEFLGIASLYSENVSKSVVLYKYEGQVIADCNVRIGEDEPVQEVVVLETADDVRLYVEKTHPYVKSLKECDIEKLVAELNDPSDEEEVMLISKHGECEFEVIEQHNHSYIAFSDKVLNKVVLEPGANYDFELYEEQFDEDEEPIEKMLIFEVGRNEVVDFVISKL